MAYNFQTFKTRLSEISEWLKKEYSGIRTGRATPTLLDRVDVLSYGARTPISHIASVSIEDPKTLRIAPWDKTNVKAIEQALHASNLGVSIAVDDVGIRCIFPELTNDTRKQLAKVLKDTLEEGRVSIKLEREKVWSDIQKQENEGVLSEDEKFKLKDELQKMVDGAHATLEEIFFKKEKEIMEV